MGLSGRESSETEERIKREKEQDRDKERPTGNESSTSIRIGKANRT